VAERVEGFDSKQQALQSIAKHLAGSSEAEGLGNLLDGMGIVTEDMTDAQALRADWAHEEVCRRLRNMGEPPAQRAKIAETGAMAAGGIWTIQFPAVSMDAALAIVRQATPAGETLMAISRAGRFGYECTGTWPEIERLRAVLGDRDSDFRVAQKLPER
jgi:hypothetical protein